MEILVAKHAGFCFGVKKAIQIAEEVAVKNKKENPESKTYVPGQLVHNEEVIQDLESKGVVFVESLDEIPSNSNVVLRAHGEPGTTYSLLGNKSIKKGDTLTDATCPLVTLVHNVAIKLKNSGYEVIIFGKKDHPESIGIKYHLNGENTLIVEHEDDFIEVVEHIKLNSFKKVAIISQTTMSVNGYSRLIHNINKVSKNSDYNFKPMHLKLDNLDVQYGYVDTICQPTRQRQFDTEDVAKKAEVMVVVGGKNSSNTKELAATCRKLGVETYFIQSEQQLQKEWFTGKKIIGVTAGASTPDSAINRVTEKIKDLGDNN